MLWLQKVGPIPYSKSGRTAYRLSEIYAYGELKVIY